MPLSLADQARLAALRSARDQLLTGKAVAKASYGSGQSVDYAQADMKALREEIAKLEADEAPRGRRRGAIRFFVR
jgi:hypothetical protein